LGGRDTVTHDKIEDEKRKDQERDKNNGPFQKGSQATHKKLSRGSEEILIFL
jgi:hypothetical protein